MAAMAAPSALVASGRSAAICLAYLALLAGCAAESARVETGLRSSQGAPTIALFPIDIRLSRLTAGGVNQSVASWTEAAEQHLSTAIRAEAAAHDVPVHMVEPKDISAPSARQALLLAETVQASATLHHLGSQDARLPGKNDRLDWTVGRAAPALHEAAGADYGLFIQLSDSYSTSGRQVLAVVSALTVGQPVAGGQQVGTAGLIDLRDGRLVWVRRLDRGSGDLRDAESARESVVALMQDFPW